MSVFSPILAAGMSHPDDRPRAGVTHSASDHGAFCRTVSLGVDVLLLLGLR